MRRREQTAKIIYVGALLISLGACSSGSGGGSKAVSTTAAMTLSSVCTDPLDGDSEAVAGKDVQFELTLNNTSPADTAPLSLISASGTVLGDIASQLPDPLPLGESVVTINYTTTTAGTLSESVDVVYQLDGTTTQLSESATADCTVISPYPDPSNPSEFPIQSDTEEGSSGDNTPGTAATLTIGETTYRTNYPVGDEDWLAASLVAGTQYEFSVDNVSYNGVPKLELYESDGTTPVTYSAADESWGAWGYFSFNPRVTFTPAASGTYYVKVYDLAGGISSFTLSSRIFSDSDGDSYSPHYDCNDTDPSIYPWATETANDTIDQSCSGYDWPVDTAEDSYEPDDTFGTAGTLPMLKGDPWDIIHRGEVYAETHSIDSGDIDYIKITVPAHSAYEIMESEVVGTSLNSTLYAADQSTVLDVTFGPLLITHWLDNRAAATPTDFYLRVEAADGVSTAGYVLGVSDGGTDADGDGYFTRSQGSGWDCDDGNININPGAVESAPNDGIDSNCNGADDY